MDSGIHLDDLGRRRSSRQEWFGSGVRPFGERRCHTSGMTNSQPPDPRVTKTWVNEAGELFISDGTSWQPYEDLPDWPGGDDLDSKALFRDDG